METEIKEIPTPLDILIIGNKGKLYHLGRMLENNEVRQLVGEAQTIMQTKLWKILINQGKYNAQKVAMIDAEAEKDDKKKLALLKEAHAYHKVAISLQQKVEEIANKKTL